MIVSENLAKIKATIPEGVQLVAVSKYHPVEALQEAYDAGQRVFGESRPQEFASKVEALKSLACESVPGGKFGDIEWHFIGHLQTNKLKLVLPYVSMVQSVDSAHLLEGIDRWGRDNGKVTDILLEMHLGAEESKQGFTEEELLDVMFRISDGAFPSVRVCGLMGMATNTDDEETIEADFERIDSYMAYLVDLFPEMEHFNQLSIGMSGDWKLAVRHGATIVRIGTSIFGERNY